MDGSVFTDAAKIGPGMWFALHTMAVKATTEHLKEAFVTNVNGLCDMYKCQSCKPHFRKFIDTHPFRNYWHLKDGKGNDIGFFKWTWELHNEVNKFLKKQQPTLDEAYTYYSDANVGACFTCGDAGTTTNVTSVPHNVSPANIPPILELFRKHPGTVQVKPFLIPETKKH